MPKAYTDEFLIDELHRFVREKHRVPTQHEMSPINGYPAGGAYTNHFGSFNNGLETAKLKPNQVRLNGSETCNYCGKRADEILNFRCWLYPNGIRYCEKHGRGQDYIAGNLDINSKVGRGRSGEILVAKALKIANEFDCNRISCGYKYDLKHEEYGKIDVKTSLFDYNYNNWAFTFRAKKDADTYICVGLSFDRKQIEHVWIVPNVGKIRSQQNFGVYNTYRSLSNRKHWEVDAKPYNDTWKNMNLGSCKIMVDKSKDNYVEPVKNDNIIDNTIKQVEQVVDKAQQRLINF